MDSPLFRKEVLTARHDEWLGDVIVRSPKYAWLWAIISVLVIAGLFLFVLLGSYKRHETVSGMLVPVDGLIALRAPGNGVITNLPIRIGQSVGAGETLVEISGDQESLELGRTRYLLASELKGQQKDLEDDIDNQRKLFTQQRSSINQHIDLLRSGLAEIEGQYALQKQKIASAEELLERIKPLAIHGYISAMQVQQQENTLIEAKNQAKSLVREQIETKSALASSEAQLTQLPLDEVTKTNEIRRQLASIRQSEATNELMRSSVVRASMPGTVATLLVTAGQVIREGQPLLTLLPSSSRLEARLLIPSRAIGFIEPGSRVAIRYQAYPYQKFGQQFGRVKSISKSALTTEELAAVGIIADSSKETIYSTDVFLDDQTIAVYGKHEMLKPGMTLEADIFIDKRRLIEWLVEPLYGITKKHEGRLNG
jgi:membrane fusion protein